MASQKSEFRNKRWVFFMSMSYEYCQVVRNTATHGNAETLSRLLLPVTTVKTEVPPEIVLIVEHLRDTPVSAN